MFEGANAVLMFVMLFGLVFPGIPVAISLICTAFAFGLFVFGDSLAAQMHSRINDVGKNFVLAAIPLFIFMGIMLQRSKIAEDLLVTMAQLFGAVPGGLGISVVFVGALLAATTGIVGATVVTMGLLSLPTMLRRGYDPALACGTISASGTLGQIIPPSIVLVVLGDQISNGYQEAQRLLGNFAPEPVSVGDLFAGAMIPGFTLVGMYILYQVIIA